MEVGLPEHFLDSGAGVGHGCEALFFALAPEVV
jgi:hypothetical protein